MVQPKLELQHKAKLLRQQGLSLAEIAKTLRVAKSSVSIWVREIELAPDQQISLQHRHLRGAENQGAITLRNKALSQRMDYQQQGRNRAKDSDSLHLAGCMLYWAEGAKGRNGVNFVNSDLNMMLLFLRFLKQEFQITDEEIAIRIHCHSKIATEICRIEQYWLTELKLPSECLKKTYLKVSGNTRNYTLPNGICDLRVHRTEIVQHIFGAIQEYGGFERPEWLG